MSLTPGQKKYIEQFVPIFNQYVQSGDHTDDFKHRKARSQLYSQLLSPDALNQMTELEFGQVISSLWASQMWSKKGYLVDKLIQDNGLPTLVNELEHLLWGEGSLPSRYDRFRKTIKGLGPSSITEILAHIYPEECGLWNSKVRKALEILGFAETFPTLKKYHITGQEYQAANALLTQIRDELIKHDFHDIDLLGVDYFLYEVWHAAKDGRLPYVGQPTKIALHQPQTNDRYDFDHDEVIDQLVAVGNWLGFQAEKEKTVARGARVDAIWQASIANLGVVTYVFEVQRRGSVDSLILNLQRAQNNPSVQRLIVVANPHDIAAIEREIESLPESFRKTVGYMEAAEAMRAAELLEELSEIINKLELVRSEFGV